MAKTILNRTYGVEKEAPLPAEGHGETKITLLPPLYITTDAVY